jgi:hypothetical protein
MLKELMERMEERENGKMRKMMDNSSERKKM